MNIPSRVAASILILTLLPSAGGHPPQALAAGNVEAGLGPVDPWRAGLRDETWLHISRVQRYPLWSDEEPNWAELARDPNPAVRAATAVAIGRLRAPDLIEPLRVIAESPEQVVRACAYWALVRMPTPKAQRPLMRAFRNWERLPRWATRGTADDRWPTPPPSLMRRPREERRQWLDEIDPRLWEPIPEAVRRDEESDRDDSLMLCPKVSQLDGGESLSLRLGFVPHPVEAAGEPDGDEDDKAEQREEKKWTLHLANKTANWQRLADDAGRIDYDTQEQRLPLKQAELPGDETGEITVEADEEARLEIPLSSRRHNPLLPGVYLLLPDRFGLPSPVFVRIQRSRAFEKKIPDLIDRIPNEDAVEKLSEQRVRKAGPPMIEAFKENPQANFSSFWSFASALAGTRHPAAVPFLLDHARRGRGHYGVKYLLPFGEKAYPAALERVERWRKLAREDQITLIAALELLSEADLAEKQERRLKRICEEILRELSGRSGNLTDAIILGHLVARLGETHPEAIAEALWRIDRGFNAINRAEGQDARRIIELLWQRRQEVEPGSRRWRSLIHIAIRRAPGLLLDSDGNLQKGVDALAVAKQLDYVRDTQVKRAVAEAITPAVRREGTAEMCLRLAEVHLDAVRLDRAEPLLDRAIETLRQEVTEEDNPGQEEGGQQREAGPDRENAQERDPQHRRRQRERKQRRRNLTEALYHRGRLHLARGEPVRAEKDLAEAHEWAEPFVHHHQPGLTKPGVEHWLTIARRTPRGPRLEVRVKGARRSGRALGNTDGYLFARDDRDRIRRITPMGREAELIATVPYAKAWKPLDSERIVVSFEHRVAMYELGDRKARWIRTITSAYPRVETASGRAVTVVDADGTLWCLDADTGETRWSRPLLQRDPSHHHLRYKKQVHQHGDALIFDILEHSERSKGLHAFGLRTGEPLWTHGEVKSPVEFIPSDGRAGEPLFVSYYEEPEVRIAALDPADGSVLWRRRLGTGLYEFRMSPDRKILYISTGRWVWAADTHTGRFLWTWRWPMLGVEEIAGRRARMVPTEQGLWVLFKWTTTGEGDEDERSRVDVILLSTEGEFLVSETASYTRDIRVYLRHGFTGGRGLALKFLSYWQVWRYEDDG